MSEPLSGNRFWKLVTAAFGKLGWAETRDGSVLTTDAEIFKFTDFLESFYSSTKNKWRIKPCSRKCPSITPPTGTCSISWHVLSLRDSPLLPLSLWDRGKKTSRTAHADVGQESASLSRGSCVWGNTYRPWVLHQNLLGCYGSVIHVNQIWSRINMREEGF